MKKITKIIITTLSAFVITGVVAFTTNIKVDNIQAVECDHVGHHYAHKDPTANECGWNEYWVCCKCHKSFTTKPVGVFTDQDASKMLGKPDPTMTGIYLAPLNGGSNGDYYVTDPFEEN